MKGSRFGIIGAVLIFWSSLPLAYAQPVEPTSAEGNTAEKFVAPKADPGASCGASQGSQGNQNERLEQELRAAFRAEQEALTHIQSWSKRAQKDLEAAQDSMFVKERVDFRAKYDACVANLEVPGEGTSPHCLAWVKKDPAQCETITGEKSRLTCRMLAVRVQPLIDLIRELRKSGSGSDLCTSERVASTVLIAAPICRALVDSKTCDLKDLEKGAKGLCELVQASKTSQECNTPEGQNTPVCQLAGFASKPDPNKACREAEQAGTFVWFAYGCELMEPMWESCSPEALAWPVEILGDLCPMVQAWTNEGGTSDGLFKDEPFFGGIFRSLTGPILGTPGLCDQIIDTRMREVCLSLLAQTVEECPEVFGDERLCREMLWYKSVSPASGGRTLIHFTLTNIFPELATCKVDFTWGSEESLFTQSLSVKVPRKVLVHRKLYLLTPEKGNIDVAVKCEWEEIVQ